MGVQPQKTGSRATRFRGTINRAGEGGAFSYNSTTIHLQSISEQQAYQSRISHKYNQVTSMDVLTRWFQFKLGVEPNKQTLQGLAQGVNDYSRIPPATVPILLCTSSLTHVCQYRPSPKVRRPLSNTPPTPNLNNFSPPLPSQPAKSRN